MTYTCLFTHHEHRTEEEADMCIEQHKDLKNLPFKEFNQSRSFSNYPHGVSSLGRWERFD